MQEVKTLRMDIFSYVTYTDVGISSDTPSTIWHSDNYIQGHKCQSLFRVLEFNKDTHTIINIRIPNNGTPYMMMTMTKTLPTTKTTLLFIYTLA